MKEFTAISNLTDHQPIINDSRATLTAENVFSTAWSTAQKYGFNESSEADLITPQDMNVVFADAIQATAEMCNDITYYDQSAILAIAEVQFMALAQSDVRFDIKHAAMSNLRNIILTRDSYNSAVLYPIFDATRNYLKFDECPNEIKADFSIILEQDVTPTFVTRLPDALFYETEKLTPVTASIQIDVQDSHLSVDSGEHAVKQLAQLRLINHPIVQEVGCRFLTEEVDDCAQGIFLRTDKDGTTDLYTILAVEASNGWSLMLYSVEKDGKTIYGVFDTDRDKTTDSLYISNSDRLMDRHSLLNQLDDLFLARYD